LIFLKLHICKPGFPLVLKSLEKCLNFVTGFFNFLKSVQAGFYSGPDSVAFGEYADISCMHVM